MDSIAMAHEFYRPVSRPLTSFEQHDVMSNLVDKLRANLMLLLCADGGDCIELRHDDLMIVLYGLHEEAMRLDEVLRNRRGKST